MLLLLYMVRKLRGRPFQLVSTWAYLWPTLATTSCHHGAWRSCALAALLGLELPMLKGSGFWLEVLARGPPPPSSQSGRGASLLLSPQSPTGDDVCSPKPQADGLAAKDFW